jgi:CDP-glucose 4,6-dehydratase
MLYIDSSKARAELGWRPIWDFKTSLARTMEWYRAHQQHGRVLSAEQLEAYQQDAGEL